MSSVQGRDLDLDLLPVLVAVAETGSVTAAAAARPQLRIACSPVNFAP